MDYEWRGAGREAEREAADQAWSEDYVRQLREVVTCPHCRARPGEACLNVSGRRRSPHDARLHAAMSAAAGSSTS